MRAYWIGVLAAALLATPAAAQMSLEDVMGNAVRNPDNSYENRQRRDNFNRDFTNQLLDSLTTGQPQNYEDTYERYYGDESGYRDPYEDPYYQDPSYDDGYAEPRNDSWRDDVANSPAARRHQAYEQARQRDQRHPLSANRPDEAWRAVHGAQPYGNKDFAKRGQFDQLEDLEISEDDLRAATDKTGVIDVNKLPDSAPAPRTPSSNWSLEELEQMSSCCPSGPGWMSVYSFCQQTTWEDGKQKINLYSKGTRETPNGACSPGPWVPNPFLKAEDQGF